MSLTWHLERIDDPEGLTDAELLRLAGLAQRHDRRLWAKLQPAVQVAQLAEAGGSPAPTILSPEPLRAEGGW